MSNDGITPTEQRAPSIADRRRERIEAHIRNHDGHHIEFSLEDYSEMVRRGFGESTMLGMILHEVPRSFMAMTREQRARELEVAPTLTGTKWDALLAAMVEHVAWLHVLETPSWVHQPERFMKHAWVIATSPSDHLYAMMWSPAAFVRHGTILDPRSLDARGGDLDGWGPLDRQNEARERTP